MASFTCLFRRLFSLKDNGSTWNTLVRYPIYGAIAGATEQAFKFEIQDLEEVHIGSSAIKPDFYEQCVNQASSNKVSLS